jgi:hypothetical protein
MKNRDLIISNLRESISSLETIIEGLKTGFVFGRTRPVSAFSQRQQWVVMQSRGLSKVAALLVVQRQSESGLIAADAAANST